MTTGMPELGSKISLISKADIRYEGHLFTVDPQECTIALASVRSFGTEDRETQYPVPAQPQVYDYILFRGSDIKDIRVVNNVTHQQPLNDPAIMQLSVPPTLSGQSFQRHPVLGPMGAAPTQLGQFGGPYASMGGLGAAAVPMGPSLGMAQRTDASRGLKPSELIAGPGSTAPSAPPAPSVLSPTVEPSRPSQINDNGYFLDLIGGGVGAGAVGSGAVAGGSRSTTPASLSSRKSPTNEQGVQTSGGRNAGHQEKRPSVRPIQPPGSGGGGQRGSAGGQQMRRKSRERRDSRGADAQQRGGMGGPNRNQGNQNQISHPNGGFHHQGGYHQQQQQQNNRAGGGNWNARGGQMRPNRGKQRGAPGGTGFRPGQGQAGQGSKSKAGTLKFENDYDFEQANTQFEELRSQLGKVKLDDGGGSSSTTKSEASTTATVTTTTNGDASDKKDDSGNETGAGETEQEEDHEVYYDRTKSFFDKISCEAVERAKGKSQRTDWRTERKLNSETFGVAATRRGGYRGRGAYRGVGFRGGYRSNYRLPQRRDHHIQQPQQNSSQQSNQQQGNRSQELLAKGGDKQRSATAVEPVEAVVVPIALGGGGDAESSDATAATAPTQTNQTAADTNIRNKDAIPVPACAGP